MSMLIHLVLLAKPQRANERLELSDRIERECKIDCMIVFDERYVTEERLVFRSK
jgi:hypothetical protein